MLDGPPADANGVDEDREEDQASAHETRDPTFPEDVPSVVELRGGGPVVMVRR